MKAEIKEAHTATATRPEQRIWVVTMERHVAKVAFTFRSKKPAKAFKAIHDEYQPTITVF